MNVKNKIKKINSDIQSPPITKIKIIKKPSDANKKITKDEIAPSFSYLSCNKAKIVPRNISLVSSYKVKEKFKKDDAKSKLTNNNKYRKKTSKMDISLINTVSENIEYIKWKKLDIDVKKQKIEEFYEKINEKNNDNNSPLKIDVKIKTLFDLVDKKKFFLKKDLQYDKINQLIENILIFEDECEKRGFIDKLQKQKNKELKKQKKSIEKRTANKKAVKKLFK
jgi:hypothetical protein